MAENKRLTIRLVAILAQRLKEIARARGISVNALITEMAWRFINEYHEH